MKDIRQSPAWANYLESIGWKIEKLNDTYIYLKNIPILGWYTKIQRPKQFNNLIVQTIINKYKPFQVMIEPTFIKQVNNLTIQQFKLSKLSSLPTKTLQIDLKRSQYYLLKNLSQKTRYNIKLAGRKGVRVTQSKDIQEFTKFWRKNFEKKLFPVLSQQKNILQLHKAFEKDSQILIAKKDNIVIAVLLLLFYDKVAYYMYAATSNEGRKNFAPTLLTWEAILLAKKMNCKIFDFDGIYDERFPIKTWKGFTKFKKGFGGNEVRYPGCFVASRSIIKL